MSLRTDPERLALRAFVALFLGWPAWWLLGVSALVPLGVACLMLGALGARRGPVHLPSGIGLWLLFLVWVSVGVLLLGVDAPGAAPGGDGTGRLLVFGYRWAWYVACTVVLVWLGNTDRRTVSDRTVHGLVAWIFLITTAGGVLGLVVPHLEFTSALEAVLPRGLRSNSFVASLVHPEVADVQTVLGRSEARPKAPFAFTNTWGSVLALSAVFACAWALTGQRRHRVLVALGLGVAAVPVVFSLNRGLWGCAVIGVVGVVLLGLRHGRAGHLVLGATVVLVVGVLAAGPLVSMVNERLAHQHSNERRGQLASTTVDSVTQGSPVVGFGTTRDVQGSFASISGGSTPDCPACGVPPMGTQGHFWLVLFSQGWIGVALFGSFGAAALSRCWRCRTPNETVATFCLAFFALQVFVYDTLGLPLLLVFMAVALVWREQRTAATDHAPPRGALTTAQVRERVRSGAPTALALAAVGATGGWIWAATTHSPAWSTRVQVVLSTPRDPYSPTVLGEVTGAPLAVRELRPTIDTEAALVLSESTVESALRASGESLGRHPAATAAALRRDIRISAVPTTRVVVLDVSAPDAPRSQRRATALAETYLKARQDYLDDRRAQLLAQVSRDLRTVAHDAASSSLQVRLRTTERRLSSDTGAVGRVVSLSEPVPQPRAAAVPVTSGLAVGVLAGAQWAGARRTRGRGPTWRRRRQRGGQRQRWIRSWGRHVTSAAGARP